MSLKGYILYDTMDYWNTSRLGDWLIHMLTAKNSMIDNFEERKKSLISEIHSAFANEAREGSISLHEAIAILSDSSLEDQQAARKRDTDIKWSDISYEDLDKSYESMALAVISQHPVSFRYYIPAIICEGLLRCPESTDLLNYATSFFFQDHGPNTFRQSEPEVVASKYLFSTNQIKAIASLLQFCSDFEIIFGGLSSKAFAGGAKKWMDFAQGQLTNGSN